jgi:hypothetical protein
VYPASVEGKATTLERPPIWIYLAALAMPLSALLPISEPRLINLLALLVAIVFAGLLVRGSRVAWIVALVGALGQPVETMVTGGLDWSVPLSVVMAGCLLAPPSLHFIWQSEHRRRVPLRLLSRAYDGARELSYRALAYFAGWETEVLDRKPWEPGRYRSLLVRVGCCTLILLVLVTFTYNWQQTQPSRAMGILADVMWTLYAVFQVAFIALGLVAIYRRLSHGRQASTSGRSR